MNKSLIKSDSDLTNAELMLNSFYVSKHHDERFFKVFDLLQQHKH